MERVHRLESVDVCLHIAAYLYAFLGIALLGYAVNQPAQAQSADPEAFMLAILAVLSFVFAALPAIIAWGLRRRRFWAWVSGVILFGIYLPTVFLPLGVIGLRGLLNAGSRAEVGIHSKSDLSP